MFVKDQKALPSFFFTHANASLFQVSVRPRSLTCFKCRTNIFPNYIKDVHTYRHSPRKHKLQFRSMSSSSEKPNQDVALQCSTKLDDNIVKSKCIVALSVHLDGSFQQQLTSRSPQSRPLASLQKLQLLLFHRTSSSANNTSVGYLS